MSIDCNKVQTIQDVTEQWDYLDAIGAGPNDSSLVSCGQDENSNGYSELKDKYEKYYSHYAESAVAKAMCECCKEEKKDYTGLAAFSDQWEKFHNCLSEKGFKKK